jgi:hypothetical protein
MGSTKRARDNRRQPWPGAPDSVRCTRGLQAKLCTFWNFQRHFAIIHQTVRCTTEQCPVLQESDSELASFGNPLRYNSPDMSGAHRTVRWASGVTAIPRQRSPATALNARQRAQRSRARAGGTPDSLQDLSGAPPDSRAGPLVRTPTVRTQRPGDVAGAPDSVGGAPDYPVRHATAASTKRLVWWLGL